MANPSAGLQQVLSNPAHFEELVGALQNTNNEVRNQAEAIFNELKEHPDACLSLLVQLMRQSSRTDNRMFCAVMLRKVFTYRRDHDQMLWERASAQVQTATKQELLTALTHEPEKLVVHKVCDTVAELACLIFEEPGWPELMPTLHTCLGSNSMLHVQSALSVLGEIARLMAESFKNQLPGIVTMLGNFLGSADAGVQLAAAKTTGAFIEGLDDSTRERDMLQPLVEPLLSVLGGLLNRSEEEDAQEVLSVFISIAELSPRFLRAKLVPVVDAMLTIAQAANLDAQTRILAAEFLVVLCEARDKAPGMMRKLPDFSTRLVTVLMSFLLDLEDDPLWHGADNNDHENEGEGDMYDMGQECLDRVALSLGGNAMVAALGPLLVAWHADADWKKRQAVLISLAQVAEGCAKVMAKPQQLGQLASMCVSGLQDSHPKVRWAACQALGQMCTDLGPDLQGAHHTTLLPALLRVMEDFNAPRVQAHACAAAVNFSESVDPEVLPPYLDQLMSTLITLLQNGKAMVREGALTALASVADSSQTLFVKYYDHVMPLLFTILSTCREKHQRLLRAKALECISLVGMAVGKERFKPAAEQVLVFMQEVSTAQLESDDPTMGYVLQAGARLCKCLGQDFLPYLPHVMPPLLRSVMLDPDVQVHDEDDELPDEEDGDREVVPFAGRMLTYRSSILDEKATAVDMLSCYADELKEGFLPYVPQVLELVTKSANGSTPLLRFFLHEDIRRSAAQILPSLLRSYVIAAEKGAPGIGQEQVAGLFSAVAPPLIEALLKEPDEELQVSMIEALGEAVDMVDRAIVPMEVAVKSFEALDKILGKAEERRKERAARQHHEDFDAEELEALQEEDEIEAELFDQVGTLAGIFLKKYGDDALPLVEPLMATRYTAFLTPQCRSNEDRRIAVCLIDELLEHSAAARAKYMGQVLPLLLDGCRSTDADLRQCSVYGLSVCASKAPDMFQPHVAATLDAIAAMVRDPEAKSDDNEMATDNALSCLGRLIQYHAASLGPDPGAVVGSWLAGMPLKGDKVEAQAMHALLVQLVEAQDARLLGPQGPGGGGAPVLAQVAGVLAEVLGAGTQLIDGQVGLKAAALLRSLLAGAVPADIVQSKLTSAKAQANYQAFMEGRVPEPTAAPSS